MLLRRSASQCPNSINKNDYDCICFVLFNHSHHHQRYKNVYHRVYKLSNSNNNTNPPIKYGSVEQASTSAHLALVVLSL